MLTFRIILQGVQWNSTDIHFINLSWRIGPENLGCLICKVIL